MKIPSKTAKFTHTAKGGKRALTITKIIHILRIYVYICCDFVANIRPNRYPAVFVYPAVWLAMNMAGYSATLAGYSAKLVGYTENVTL